MITQKDMARFFSPDDRCPIIKMSHSDHSHIRCMECRQIKKRQCGKISLDAYREKHGRGPDEMQFLKHISTFGHWVNCEFWNVCLSESDVTAQHVLSNQLTLTTLMKNPDVGVFISGRWVPLRQAIEESFDDTYKHAIAKRKYKSTQIWNTSEPAYADVAAELEAAKETDTLDEFMRQHLGFVLGKLDYDENKKIREKKTEKYKDPKNVIGN